MAGTITDAQLDPPRLWVWSLYAAMLSGAGLPIYIYAPTFYAQERGVSLATLGAVLFGLRLLDVVQDPALGWLAERIGRFRAPACALVALIMGLAVTGLSWCRLSHPPCGSPSASR